MFSYGQRSKCADLLNSYNSAYICIAKKSRSTSVFFTCRPAFIMHNLSILVQEVLNNNALRLFLGKSQRPKL